MSSLPIMPCKKIPYLSRGDATRAAKAAPGQRPYECPHCGQYHLFSKSKREVKATRRRVRPRVHPTFPFPADPRIPDADA